MPERWGPKLTPEHVVGVALVALGSIAMVCVVLFAKMAPPARFPRN